MKRGAGKECSDVAAAAAAEGELECDRGTDRLSLWQQLRAGKRERGSKMSKERNSCQNLASEISRGESDRRFFFLFFSFFF